MLMLPSEPCAAADPLACHRDGAASRLPAGAPVRSRRVARRAAAATGAASVWRGGIGTTELGCWVRARAA